MKYLYDYKMYPNFLRGELEEIFLEELENSEVVDIEYRDRDVTIEMCKKANVAYIDGEMIFVSEIESVCNNGRLIVFFIRRLGEKKRIEIYIDDEKIAKQFILNLHAIIKCKEKALTKYDISALYLSSNYKEYYLNFKFDNETIFWRCYGYYDEWDNEKFAQHINLIKENNEIYMQFGNEKIMIPDVECKVLKAVNLDDVYCSKVELDPLEDDYVVKIKMLLYVKKSD